jgi:hypothetical protein
MCGEGDEIADFCRKRNSVVKTVIIYGENFTVDLNLLTKQNVINWGIRLKTTINVHFKINASSERKMLFNIWITITSSFLRLESN